MEVKFVNITKENVSTEHLSCIVRKTKPHIGVEAKRMWLSKKLKGGHVFRKLDVSSPALVEYEPLETAWVPIEGKNYMYIYCLWVSGEFKGKGYGKKLIEYVISDAKAKKKSGICMLNCNRPKTWLTNKEFAEKYGFKTVDTTNMGYEVLALPFDGTYPHFTESAKKEEINSDILTIYYDMQCPYVLPTINMLRTYCNENNIPLKLVEVCSTEEAKSVPCAFNNFAVFYKGKFETVNLLDIAYLKRILKK